MTDRDELVRSVRRDAKRLARHERGRPTLIGLALYGGTLGLLFVVPIVGGAYLGRWLDAALAGYSVRWTISLILLGIGLGAYNVYRFVRDRL
jgi:ATP synthase protein I